MSLLSWHIVSWLAKRCPVTAVLFKSVFSGSLMVRWSYSIQHSKDLIFWSVWFSYYSSISSLVGSFTFSFHSLMLLWCGMLFTLFFCPLFTVISVWLLIFLVLCYVLSGCVSLVLFPVGTLFNCSLWVYVLFCCVWFSNCFRMSSTGSVILCV